MSSSKRASSTHYSNTLHIIRSSIRDLQLTRREAELRRWIVLCECTSNITEPSIRSSSLCAPSCLRHKAHSLRACYSHSIALLGGVGALRALRCYEAEGVRALGGSLLMLASIILQLLARRSAGSLRICDFTGGSGTLTLGLHSEWVWQLLALSAQRYSSACIPHTPCGSCMPCPAAVPRCNLGRIQVYLGSFALFCYLFNRLIETLRAMSISWRQPASKHCSQHIM